MPSILSKRGPDALTAREKRNGPHSRPHRERIPRLHHRPAFPKTVRATSSSAPTSSNISRTTQKRSPDSRATRARRHHDYHRAVLVRKSNEASIRCSAAETPRGYNVEEMRTPSRLRTTSLLRKCPPTSTPSGASSSVFSSTIHFAPPSWRHYSICSVFLTFSTPRCDSASLTASASRSGGSPDVRAFVPSILQTVHYFVRPPQRQVSKDTVPPGHGIAPSSSDR